VIQPRIGAFGGTFDPIHNGHVAAAREVVRNFELDRLLIIPAYRPPHKTRRAISDAYHRYTMAVLATLDEPTLVVSTLELEAPERPYTVETISRLRDTYGEGAELFFIMGADSFQEVNTWHESERVLQSANWVVVARPGHDFSIAHLAEHLRSQVVDLRGGRKPAIEKTGPGKRPCTFLTDYVSEDLSSTLIRERVRKGQEVAGLVPGLVAGYIEKYELYER
jgi:nicotinate-nucleotide adenylyltransferase